MFHPILKRIIHFSGIFYGTASKRNLILKCMMMGVRTIVEEAKHADMARYNWKKLDRESCNGH